MALHARGSFEKYGVKLIGANVDAIKRGEDREIFKTIVAKVGGESAKSRICHSMSECLAAALELNYPVVVRPSFTMGGLGSGIAFNQAELELIAGAGLRHSPTNEVLLEESILGWKEYELEVMRDNRDNVVIACLECNMRRRTMYHERYLATKQLRVNKLEPMREDDADSFI